VDPIYHTTADGFRIIGQNLQTGMHWKFQDSHIWLFVC